MIEQIKNDTMTAESIQAFRRFLENEEKSPHTVQQYMHDVGAFFKFLPEDKKLGKEAVIQYKAEPRERYGKPVTVNTKLCAVNKYLAFMNLYHCQVKSIKVQRSMFRDAGKELTRAEYIRLLNVAKQKKDLRLFLLMETICATGIRVGKNPGITVIGKGRKVRTLPILPRTVAYLKKYLQEFHGNAPDPDSYVFYSRNMGPYGKLSQPAINKMLKKYAQQANTVYPGVPLTLHAHQIRHARATHWLEDGVNIVQISHLLGHAQVENTMVYLDVSLEQTANALAALEYDEDRTVMPKWKPFDNGLAAFCGCRSL